MAELVQVRKKAQVTLPLSVRRKLGIEEGDYMDVKVRGGEVVLKPKKLVDKDQTARRLLSKITRDNLHHEVATGQPVGNEVW